MVISDLLETPSTIFGSGANGRRPSGEKASSDVFTGTILVRLLRFRTSAWASRGFGSAGPTPLTILSDVYKETDCPPGTVQEDPINPDE